MNKITLDLDLLDVQSFETTPETVAPRGTVLGHSGGEYTCATCAATMCGGGVTNDDPACGTGESADCPSVNPMGCPSAEYTWCCEQPSAAYTWCCGPRETDTIEDDCT